MTKSRKILIRMKNVSNETWRENQNTYFMFNKSFSRKSCLLRDNVKKYGGARETADGNMAARCWITNATLL
jgi:hypothetical protein